MKKTLSIILAVSSFAMGATEIPVQWEGSGGRFPEGTPSVTMPISVLIQINLKEIGDLNPYGSQPLFTWSTADTLYSGGVYVDSTWGTLSVQGYAAKGESTLSLPVFWGSPKSGYEQSLLGYTYTPGGEITLSLINVKTGDVFEEMQQWSTTSTLPADTQITLSDTFLYYPGSVSAPNKLYNGVLTQTEMETALKAIVKPDSPSVPEPATATLSLLALAGLAARRRRK